MPRYPWYKYLLIVVDVAINSFNKNFISVSKEIYSKVIIVKLDKEFIKFIEYQFVSSIMKFLKLAGMKSGSQERFLVTLVWKLCIWSIF